MIVRGGAGAGFEFLSDDAELQGRIAGLIQKLSNAPSPGVVEPSKTREEGGKRGLSRNLWGRPV
jgi:hypothetical protein